MRVFSPQFLQAQKRWSSTPLLFPLKTLDPWSSAKRKMRKM
jgi:hypothetical protein